MPGGGRWGRTARLLGRACRRWIDDGASRQGAAIAFYATLSLAPFLLVLAAVAAFFLGPDAARGYIVDQSGALVGTEGGALLKGMLGAGGSAQAKGWAAAIGLVSTLAGATAGFAELQTALNRVFRVPERHGVRATLTSRLWSLLLVAGVGVLLVGSLAVTAFVSRSLDWFEGAARVTKWATLAANEGITLAVATVLFGLVLKVLPDRRVPWRFAVGGGFVTALLFQLAKFAIGWYIGRATPGAAYGTAAALVVLMLWIYFSAQVFLLGAEFTAVSLEAQDEARRLAAGAPDSAEPGGRWTTTQ